MDDPRTIELLTEMLHEQRQMRLEFTEMLQEQRQMNVRLERVEKQQQMTNLKLEELTLSNLRIADELHTFGERFDHLEAAVFH